MGYGAPTPIGSGLHQRLRARAFVISETAAQSTKVVHVTLDLGFITTPIKTGVIKTLQKKYGNVFTDANVMLSATHTHSAPGGIDNHFFYNIPSHGYSAGKFQDLWTTV
jgi:neutral ceramidase